MLQTAKKNTLLWIGRQAMPANLAAALDEHWDIAACISPEAARHNLSAAQLVVLAPTQRELDDPRPLSDLLDEVDRSEAVALVLLPPWQLENHPFAGRRGQFLAVSSAASPQELAGRLASACQLQPLIKSLKDEVAAVRGFGSGIAHTFEQLDEEMRLAARLQRDFMPHQLPQVPPARFAALFRPASWVSGDIYDVFRLDETHVGFYVADVVGHGMPAALLTMFIKKALQTKRIDEGGYQIVPPCEALAMLNADICGQDLSSCQFCTAFYGVLEVPTGKLRYARGGHPAPFLLGRDGQTQKLEGRGSLLGVFGEENFEDCQIQLRPGDRLAVYSDGAEDKLALPDQSGSALLEELTSLRGLSAEEMLFQLTSRLDQRRTSARAEDDVTLVVLDWGTPHSGGTD